MKHYRLLTQQALLLHNNGTAVTYRLRQTDIHQQAIIGQ
jgi:hypothetical protein